MNMVVGEPRDGEPLDAPRPAVTPPAVTPMTWSATRLKSLLLCPRQFRYTYRDLIPAVPTAALVFGRVMHETLCFAHEHHMATARQLEAMEVLRHFDSLWNRAVDEEQPVFSSGSLGASQYTTLAHEILRAYLRSPGTPPLAAELAFEVSAGDHTLCGIIDRVDEGESGLIIVDYKSGARKPSLDQVSRDLQLTLYAFAARQVLGQPVERVVYYYLRDGTALSTVREDSHFEWLLETVLPQAVKLLEEAEFPPHFGYWCRWCDFRELCRLESAGGGSAKGGDGWPTPHS